MRTELTNTPGSAEANHTLQVYLLGLVDFDTALTLQRRLVYETSGDRSRAALILCQHPPLITVGRQGSFSHIHFEPEDLRSRQWSVRWVNRGGGCILHLPGQQAIYPILPLDRLGLGLWDYVTRLQDVLISLLGDFSVPAERQPCRPGVWCNGRLVAAVGVAVRDWVSYYGAALNVNPCLDAYRFVQTGTLPDRPMTSLVRERRGPVSLSLVRQLLIERFASAFGFTQTVLFTDHPLLTQNAKTHAIVTHS
jgi:lipoyl(octanoyl) transferase